MYLIAGFGLLMLVFCILMAVNPKGFSQGIIRFSEQRWFHTFEVSSRAVAGIISIHYASSTLYPLVFTILGYGLIVVAIGLLTIGSETHRKFALWAAGYFENKFRPIGILTIPIGALIIYMAIGAQFG